MLLAVTVLAADAPKNDSKDTKDAKADKLDGTWTAKSMVDHGNKVDVSELKLVLILKDGKYTLKVNDNVADEGTYKTDASKSPKEIDTTASAGENKDKVDHGIYELKGDTLKTAFDEITKQNRPKEFDDQKYQVVVFTRDKK
jgi:uncharacterized protein (TIGR03067 family)